ncbi:MAG: ATP-binding cassette domain-containing protein [Gemmatimonadaceae bacterium]|nr:ATP-binding cassette domain-containing protein [Gemmatimonadaceae bacterium]
MSMRVTVDRLSKRHGKVDALRDVSLDIAPGECLALVGESGSGKTTLLRCINRLTEPDSGSVLLNGEAVAKRDAVSLRRSIGYVPQEGGLLPHWNVARNVGLVPWLDGRETADTVDTVARAMELAGLDSSTFSHRWPHELSGGQRQRVAIARALAGGQSLLLLDEPFSALDAITRSELHLAFKLLRKEAAFTSILVTHDLREAVTIADRVAVLRAGVVEQLSDVKDLKAHPATDYVRRLVDHAGLVT